MSEKIIASETSMTSSALETGRVPGCEPSEKITDVKLGEDSVGGEDGYAKESWNNPPVNKYRLLACFTLFIAASMNISSLGVMISHYEQSYSLSHTSVTWVFVTPFIGAVVAAAVANISHEKLGRRGAGLLVTASMGVGNLLLALHPPWPAVPVIMGLAGYGIAGLGPVCSAWVGSLRHSAGLLGMLEGFFGVGASIAPLIANGMIRAGIPWYQYYYVPFTLSIFGAAGLVVSFWTEDGEKYERDTKASREGRAGHTKEILRSKVSWILALCVLASWGAETTIGSWIVVFLTEHHGGSSFKSGIVNSMFWLSHTIGRFLLVWVVSLFPRRRRTKWPVVSFVSLCLVFEIMFWLLPTFGSASAAACLLGFLCGPLYPMVINVLTILLPRHLHVTAIGIGSALGTAGAMIFPTAAGAVADRAGIAMIHPLVLGTFVLELGLWLTLPEAPGS